MLLSILWIVLGLVCLGGAGFFIYIMKEVTLGPNVSRLVATALMMGILGYATFAAKVITFGAAASSIFSNLIPLLLVLAFGISAVLAVKNWKIELMTIWKSAGEIAVIFLLLFGAEFFFSL